MRFGISLKVLKNVGVRAKKRAVNHFLCPVEAFNNLKEITYVEFAEYVDDAIMERFSE